MEINPRRELDRELPHVNVQGADRKSRFGFAGQTKHDPHNEEDRRMTHKLKLTTTQASKLYALMGKVLYKDEDMRDVRRRLSNILGEKQIYRHYQPEFRIGFGLMDFDK